MRPFAHQQGFTLLEILVAFVVLALVGGALLQLFQGGLRNIDVSTHLSHAALLARAKLNELSALDNLQPGSSEGDFSDGYRWQLQLEPYAGNGDDVPPDSPLQALSATLDIHWEPDGTYRAHTLLLSRGLTQ
jgi:general secretion pathway protein I